jgi:hypothetical protein
MFNIPKSEQEAAKQRTLEKAAAIRAKKGVTKEGREHDEPGEEDNNRDVIRHNQSLRDKKGKQLYPSGRVGRARRPDISKDPRWGSVD